MIRVWGSADTSVIARRAPTAIYDRLSSANFFEERVYPPKKVCGVSIIDVFPIIGVILGVIFGEVHIEGYLRIGT